MNIKIPKLTLVVLIGPSGSGKSTFARKHFSADARSSRPTPAGAWSCDDENDQSVTNEAFEVLHFIAGKRLALGRLTVDRRHQRPARGPQAAGPACPRVPLPAGGHRPRPARKGLPGAEPRPAPTGTLARTSSASSSRNCGGRSAGLKREGSRHVFILDTPEEVEAGDDRADAALERQAGRTRAVRHHRRRARLLRRTGGPAASDSGYEPVRLAATIPRWGEPVLSPIPRAARRSSWAIWWTAARGSSTRCGWSEHGRRGFGPLRARQSRHEAPAEAPRQGRPDQARPGRHRSPRSTPCPRTIRRAVRRASSPTSSTAWSATTSSTTASSSSPMPG